MYRSNFATITLSEDAAATASVSGSRLIASAEPNECAASDLRQSCKRTQGQRLLRRQP